MECGEDMEIKINSVVYSYDVTGEGEAILLLHGFTGSKKTWDYFVPSWSKGNKVIAVDLIGHGQTESPANSDRYSVEKVAADMIGLLDFLQVETAHILGYSMGGRLAISIAALYPERIQTLILESTTAGIKSEEERESRRQQDEKLSVKIEEEGIKDFVHYWENLPLFTTQKDLPVAIQSRIREERLDQNEIGLANSLRGMGTGVQPSYWEQLKEFSFPTIILCGELDKKFCQLANLLAKELPNAFVEKFSSEGHALHVENREKFDTIVRRWLGEKGG